MRARLVTALLLAVLALPASAAAQSAGDDQYVDPFAGANGGKPKPTATATPAAPAPAPTAAPGVDLLRARLALQRGDAAGATRTALRVVRAEPANIVAWGVIALVNERRDPALAARARAALRRLSPPVPAP